MITSPEQLVSIVSANSTAQILILNEQGFALVSALSETAFKVPLLAGGLKSLACDVF
ncbi:hypothetical protein M422DRAFT_33886 [Sphaerobolus stellatus SS14]|uniref:Uncharacterized protein n=1 Tax=Sphaerobolus stellatus (strain SS14) TaxID=990650 RepID=A0A0C9VIP1_SPHS4|nr:hypothetical protein M422DRAFT_33886 [Sphaerobolus stellatus SS14]